MSSNVLWQGEHKYEKIPVIGVYFEYKKVLVISVCFEKVLALWAWIS